MEKRCNIIDFERPVDEPSSIVLNILKPVKTVFGDPERRVWQ